MQWNQAIHQVLLEEERPLKYAELYEGIRKKDPRVNAKSLRVFLCLLVKEQALSYVKQPKSFRFYTLVTWDLDEMPITYNPLLKVYEHNAHR